MVRKFFLSDFQDNIINKKNDKTFRIILLGGSNVVGIGTSGYQYNLASQIKTELKKSEEIKILKFLMQEYQAITRNKFFYN